MAMGQFWDGSGCKIGGKGERGKGKKEGRTRFFVRYWVAMVGVAGEGLGSSGAIQLADRLMEGATGDDVHAAVPGTRRAGGTIASLTGGLETRRTAVGTATLHAIATLFYGILESRPGRPR